MKRSPETITKSDLKKLLSLARSDIDSFFARNPSYKEYDGKEVIVALCQGGALHYLDKTTGVKDFDIWFFYPLKPRNLPYRRRGVVDFGESKFGVHPEFKSQDYKDRTVDVLMRSDDYFSNSDPEQSIARYLKYKNSETSNLLSQKAVIGMYPEYIFGKKLWPP
ncbi:MAG: hypothetical protein JAZ17_05560 [Candidatus Thiodiazotropha endolucinida]|nr:hypothetical protein [Candidatus Thiodiazotropha endolucinida]